MNALDRSIKTAKGTCLLSMLSNTRSINFITPSSVECFVLNPYWLSWKIYISWNSRITDYRQLFQKVQKWNKAKILVDSYRISLCRLLYRGMIFAVFYLSRYIRVMTDWLMIKRSGLISAGARNFKSRFEISSQPDDDLLRSEFKGFFQWFVIN